MRTLGLSHYIQRNSKAQLCIKMISVLAFLPTNKIEEGYYIIRRYARDKNVILNYFFTYYSNYWLGTKGPEVFSVYGLPRRTNNNIESFHGHLKEKFQTAHPNFWTFLEHLKNLNLKNHVVVKQLARGQGIPRPIKVKYLSNSARIKSATTQLELGSIDIKEFLLQCSHSTENYLRGEINWNMNQTLKIIMSPPQFKITLCISMKLKKLISSFQFKTILLEIL